MQMIPSLALNPSNLERPWKQHYVGIMKVNHTNLWNFYSSAAFYIGACPDMLIFCSCGVKELFEAKCPIIALWNVCLPGICKCQGKSIKVLTICRWECQLKNNTIMHKFRAKLLLQAEITVTFSSTQDMQLLVRGYVLILSIGQILF